MVFFFGIQVQSKSSMFMAIDTQYLDVSLGICLIQLNLLIGFTGFQELLSLNVRGKLMVLFLFCQVTLLQIVFLRDTRGWRSARSSVTNQIRR